MEGKKISFGFMKTKKVEKPVDEEKKDFIECVEEKSIKVVGGDEVKENTPLIIPMKPNTLVTAERLKEIAAKVESALEEPENDGKPPIPQENLPENETLDQMAVRELLQDAKKEVDVETPMLTVPIPAKPVNEGEKESTLDDYESVPVQDFGMAMLRGMGWAPNKEKSSYKPPQLRPKGLGLGADKVVKGNQKQKLVKDGKTEDLSIVKNAYVKITTGKYSGYYGKVVSLDEDNGRVMVDLAVKKETVSLSEFMMHPVPKSEFDKESKVINAGSYDEYKKKETMQKSSKNIEKESSPEQSTRERSKREDKYTERDATSSKSAESKYDRDNQPSRYTEKDKSNKNGKDSQENRKEKDRDRSYRSKQRRDSTEDRSSRKKKYSSNESLDSLSDTEKKTYKKKERKRHSSRDSNSQSDTDKKKKDKKKERKRHDSSGSESDHRSKRNKTPEGKRDIDKKRKGKKKKRDRDRSPNYRKHRK